MVCIPPLPTPCFTKWTINSMKWLPLSKLLIIKKTESRHATKLKELMRAHMSSKRGIGINTIWFLQGPQYPVTTMSSSKTRPHAWQELPCQLGLKVLLDWSLAILLGWMLVQLLWTNELITSDIKMLLAFGRATMTQRDYNGSRTWTVLLWPQEVL